MTTVTEKKKDMDIIQKIINLTGKKFLITDITKEKMRNQDLEVQVIIFFNFFFNFLPFFILIYSLLNKGNENAKGKNKKKIYMPYLDGPLVSYRIFMESQVKIKKPNTKLKYILFRRIMLI